jgi:diphosphate-dependent phosphofructokinase
MENIEALLKNSELINATSNISRDHNKRLLYKPDKCSVFSNNTTMLQADAGYSFDIEPESKIKFKNTIKSKVQKIVAPASKPESKDENHEKIYSKKRIIGVVFSGGPAPGGHNVIAGIYYAAKKANPENKVIGFLNGPDGIIENETIEINDALVDKYMNTGGFTMIKTGRTKIDSKEKMDALKKTCKSLEIDALVVIGGDDSNTNAAFIAEEMYDDGLKVIGVPKTIDGDVQVRDSKRNVLCAISFGFYSAAKAFSTEISRLCTDGSSDVKYWHICKVMGRVASHIALETALQTHANISIIGEELADYIDKERLEKAKANNEIDYTAYGMTLRKLSRVICDGIVKRARVGKNYGIIILPEGVLEFINEIRDFITKLNVIIAYYNKIHDKGFHNKFPMLEDKLEHLRKLAMKHREEPSFMLWNTRDEDLFAALPDYFQEGLLTERDSHGNFQFSLVKTDKILMQLVKDYLNSLKEKGIYKLGLKKSYFIKMLKSADEDPDIYGPIIFEDYNEEILIVKSSIMSLATLKQALINANLMSKEDYILKCIKKVYEKSVPNFKTQFHFYGYDGRGSDPTYFDCNYCYNLGLTAFSLIANDATAQMAVIKNLEKSFENWEPLGIPIASLLKLEERKGKLDLVIERSIVDLNDPAFLTVKANRDKWLAAEPGDDNYRHASPISFNEELKNEKPLTLVLNGINISAD